MSNVKKDRERSTFVIQILGREHATWQGKLVWSDTGETVSFRSALELLKLIDGAMAEVVKSA
ncbi:MAG: hypothetical protein Q4B96_02780 [Bacillota bacterium]|nr:hypothetical protein [Bacillota bacterium]